MHRPCCPLLLGLAAATSKPWGCGAALLLDLGLDLGLSLLLFSFDLSWSLVHGWQIS
jgi:hypothetical protein